MVTFMRSDSLRSFKTKRQELKGNVDMRSLLAKQRRAILQKQEDDKKKIEAKEKKIQMILASGGQAIQEIEEENEE